jgi:antitoxin component YwqK of YwqJK toxin-antitoxin module
MNQYNDNNERHGYWEGYHDNGQLWYKENFINGMRYGYWECYWSDGELLYKGYYLNSEEIGFWKYPFKTEFYL